MIRFLPIILGLFGLGMACLGGDYRAIIFCGACLVVVLVFWGAAEIKE